MKGIKIAHSGVNALSNTDPKNFSLFVDGTEDHILVKEKARGTVSVGAFSTHEIEHGLSYIPHFMAMVQIGSDYQWVYGLTAFSDYHVRADDDKIYLRNSSATNRFFTYIIYYDNI